MDLWLVMDEIGAVLRSIPGLRVHNYPVDSIVVPAAVVQLPAMNYDQAFQRGMDRWDGGIALMVSDRWDRAATEQIAAYTDAHTTGSIHSVLRTHDWQTCAYARATRCTFPRDGYTFNGINYVSAQIDLDIAGPGT